MIVLFSSKSDDAARWRAELAARVPDLDFRVWPDEVGDRADIEFALVWGPKRGEMRRYPNLKAIFSLGAGVDHVLRDPDLPGGVPVVRLVDAGLTRGMVEYVLHWVLHYHREFHLYARDQRARRWRSRPPPAAGDRRVGILGLGHLGRASAAPLVELGFRLAGWSRTPKDMDRVESFHGEAGMAPFLARTDILVCLLPLTPATAAIVDRTSLAALPAGAAFINAARGGHVVEADLLAALDSGHLTGATIDAFDDEPLPRDHPFWSHPKVVVTPHVASVTNPKTAAAEVAEDMRRILRGQAPRHVVDRRRGY